MTLDIMKLVFTIVIFTYWSTANDIPAAVEFPISYVDESLLQLCENELISLNFSNAVITSINEDFISSPLITCLNLTGNSIENIGRGAFNKLPNLTQLLLSDNRLPCKFLSFEGHCKLQVLVMNNARCCNNYDYYDYKGVQIFEYPNLEVLSLRNNFIRDLYLSTEKVPPVCTTSIIMPNTPFPKLRILDLSKNEIQETNFLTLLPNSLYFLDLHDNSLRNLYLNEMTNLSILNVDKNNLRYIGDYRWNDRYLSLAGLKNLRFLSISANDIETVESNAFQDNNELLYLNLSANKIYYLYPETFANLHYLKTLDLSKNSFEKVPAISNEIGISTLYINYNNIIKLMSHSFTYMPKLTKLLLGENKINEIDVNAFAELYVLEKLDLSRNILSSMPEGWSDSLISLKYLDLSDNQFTSLESSLTTAPLSLIETYLMMNPLEHLNVGYFENLPQNLTINLMNKSNFTKWMRVGE